MEIRVQIVNAFTDGGRGGNPAGIVLDADALDTPHKQNIAAAVGLSETAFVSASASADFKLEFFTPVRQIAHCGHATIAAFNYLHQLGRVAAGETSKETIDGNRKILIEGDRAYMAQLTPQYRTIGDRADMLGASLGIAPRDLPPDRPPLIVDTGNAFLLVPLADHKALGGIVPDFKAVAAMSEALGVIGYYLFSAETRFPGRDAGARMFAPHYGIPEEAATGMAAGPLACYLYDHAGLRQDVFRIEQGHAMQPPSPSVIHVRLTIRAGRIAGLFAGGQAQVKHSLAMTV